MNLVDKFMQHAGIDVEDATRLAALTMLISNKCGNPQRIQRAFTGIREVLVEFENKSLSEMIDRVNSASATEGNTPPNAQNNS